MDNKYIVRALDAVSYVLLLASVFLVPLFADKSLVNFYIIPKQYVFIGLVLLGLLCWGIKMVLTKKISYSRSILDWPILGVVILGLLSSALSVNFYYSFLGRGEFFILNFIFLFFLAAFYFLTINVINTPKRWQGVVDALILTGGITAVLFFIEMIFGFSVIKYWIGSNYNTISQLNQAFGLWTIFIFVLAAGQIIKKNIQPGKLLFYFFVTFLSFVVLGLLGFSTLWWILLCGLVLLLLVGASFVNNVRMGWLSVLFTFLVLTVVFITFGSPKSLQQNLPPEVSLGVRPSWNISFDTALSGIKEFVVGSGLGTYAVDFSAHRPANFNYDSTAWSLRFGQPFNTLFALLAEGGVLFTVAFLFLFFFVLGHILHSWFKVRSEGAVKSALDEISQKKLNLKIDIFLVSVTWILLSVSMVLLFWEPVMWWMWWLMLGLVISGLSFINSNIITDKEWKVEETPQYSLSFSFVTIVVLMALVMAGVWGVKIYLGERAYAQALSSQDLASAESKLGTAISQRGSADSYYVALAQVYLLKAAQLSQQKDANMQQVSALLAVAVNSAKKATDLSPKSVSLWENLATMYENTSVLIPQARDWAIKSWTQAIELEPTNPVLYYRLGVDYITSETWDKAEENFKKAIELKSDYASAYSGLASVYEKNSKVKEAMATYEKVLGAGVVDIDLYYNYARLLYNRNQGDDRAKAESLWNAILSQSPNHSNTLYSMGLLYESRGNMSKALEYYYKVRDLNPGNQDITNKIKSLVGGSLSDNSNSENNR